MKAEAIEWEIDGKAVRITSPDKIFFPHIEASKAELIEYYLAVAGPFLAANRDRPTMLQRFPDGAAGKSFYQKRVPDGAPDWLETTVVSTPNGTTSNALVLADLAHVAWAVNLGCLGFHPWPYRSRRPEFTDELRIDLDPSPGNSFEQVREAATEVHALFVELGIDSGAKTTGNRGLHIYVPLIAEQDSYVVRAAAVAVARELERRRPDLCTAAWWKEERGERVFVDFNQNAPHKTVFGAWAVRPRVGGQVSTPFPWDELPDISPETLTLRVVPGRLADQGDPWAGLEPQSLAPLSELSERDLADGLPDAPWPPVYPKMPGEPPRVAPSRARAPQVD